MEKKYLSWMTVLLAVVFSMGFVACSDDDDDSGVTVSNLVGTWYFEDGEGGIEWIIRENGTGVETENYDGDKFEDPFTWKLEDNVFHVWYTEDANDYYMYRIVSLNGNKLVLADVEDEDGQYRVTLTKR